MWADGRKDTHTDRQTDRGKDATKLIDFLFRDFSNAPKNNCNKYDSSQFNNSAYIDVNLYISILIYCLMMS